MRSGTFDRSRLFKSGVAVKADGLGGAEHALGRRLADAMARVQHPVDGGDADPGGAGKIGDGRAAQTKGSAA